MTQRRKEIMARIAGVDLPREKRLEYGLTYIYGIGVETSRNICKEIFLEPLSPSLPDEHEEITLPCISVKTIMLLLKEVVI